VGAPSQPAADPPPAAGAGLDRASDAGHSLRRRRGLPAGEVATGAEMLRRLDRLSATDARTGDLTALARRSAAGDRAARERLVERSLPLVLRTIRRYEGQDVERADLIQEGVLGVLRALERYDPGRDVPFAAYAGWWLRQSMQQAIAEQSRAVRLPTHVLWDIHRLREERERRYSAAGRDPASAELAHALEWTDGHLDDVLRAERPAASLDAPYPGDEGEVTALGDLVADPLSAEAFEQVLHDAASGSIRALLSTLTERERQIIGWRFGLDGEELSLRQVGRRLGMSAERVRQIEARALAKLRTAALPRG
jgi:RNA polymerase primary sigma factor